MIDWVQQNPDQPAPPARAIPGFGEPSVTSSGLVPDVAVTPLDEEAIRIIGLVPASVTGLPQTLWHQSDPKALSQQLRKLPEFHLPAAQSLLYTALLTEARGPGRDAQQQDIFTLARVAALQRFGALDPALALIEQTDITRDAAHFSTYMDVALLSGQEGPACGTLAAQPHLSPSMGHRIFCTARQGDWATATLLFDSGKALSLMSREEAAALDRFLHPEFFDGLPPLRQPRQITPLLFRLHEAIGEPLPTRLLPRAYAVADLRDLAGWKAQLEAAERLAKTGALPDNRLLGLYSERKPAASGGIWDRVGALQQFDTALRTRSAAAVTKTLPRAWKAMQDAGLEVAFAGLFAPDLSTMELAGKSARIAEDLAFLSPLYRETAARSDVKLLRTVAAGDPTGLSSDNPLHQAIIDGFAAEAGHLVLVEKARAGRLGEAILRALVLLEEGASGDPLALRDALATLRALGFEETMRRAALQILLLARFG